MTSRAIESESVTDPSERQLLDDFLLRYAHTLDDEDVEAWPSFFHEQGLYQITTRANHEAGRPIRDHVVRQSRHDGRSDACITHCERLRTSHALPYVKPSRVHQGERDTS